MNKKKEKNTLHKCSHVGIESNQTELTCGVGGRERETGWRRNQTQEEQREKETEIQSARAERCGDK